MYEKLVKRLRELPYLLFVQLHGHEDVVYQAAEAIESLISALTASNEVIAKSKPRWIPVTEQLPEKYHQVLVYGLNGMQIDYYAGEKSIGGRPLFMISEAKVTHWMPPQEPPKGVLRDA